MNCTAFRHFPYEKHPDSDITTLPRPSHRVTYRKLVRG